MILPPGTHCSRLSRNGSHMSTHTASIPFRWRLVNSVRKYSSSVSFLRSFPNHNGSAVSRLHTTVRNLSPLPLVQLVHPHVSQRRLPPAGLATLQVPEIDSPYRALCQTHPAIHLPR